MKNVFYLVCILLFSSCFGNWDLGATVDESATEESTIYHYVRLDIMQNNKNLNFNSFANNHEEIIKKGEDHFVKSWYLSVSKEGDSIINEFSCKVIWDKNDVSYKVRDLKINRKINYTDYLFQQD